MTIARKAVKKPEEIAISQSAIEKVISQGGSVAPEPKETSKDPRFILRIPHELLQKIDHHRRTRVGKVSRNQWLIEAASYFLKSIQ